MRKRIRWVSRIILGLHRGVVRIRGKFCVWPRNRRKRTVWRLWALRSRDRNGLYCVLIILVFFWL